MVMVTPDFYTDTPTDRPVECPRIFLRTYFILVLKCRLRSHFCDLLRIFPVTVTQNFYGHSCGLSGGMSADFPTDVYIFILFLLQFSPIHQEFLYTHQSSFYHITPYDLLSQLLQQLFQV